MAIMSCCGCTLYQPRPTTFTIRDGDTGEPIAGADVSTHYLTMLDFGVLLGSIGPTSGKTDSNGKITFIVDPQKYCFQLHVHDESDSSRSYVRVVNNMRQLPTPWYQYREEFEVTCFRDPKPEAIITVPAGYRGPVVVKFADDEYPKLLNGKRVFEYTADDRGHVTIPDVALFGIVADISCFVVKTADGKKYPATHGGKLWMTPEERAEVVFKPLDRYRDSKVWLFWLGNDEEFERIDQELHPKDGKIDDAVYRRIVDGK